MICASRGVVLYGPGGAWVPQNFLCPPEFFQARRHCVHQNVVVCGMFDLRSELYRPRAEKKFAGRSGRARPHHNDD